MSDGTAARGHDEAYWQKQRAAVRLAPGLVYLNTGSYGLLPERVHAALAAWREQLYANPTDFLWRSVGPALWAARCRVAAFLGGGPERLIFTPNVSEAINLVARSLRPRVPGEILLSDHEYRAMHWVWERTAVELGLVLRVFKLPILSADPQALAEAVIADLRPTTRVLFLSHVLHTTGLVVPVAPICAAARQRGILTVIDAAHAPGMIPIQLDAIGADFYASNLHKWLLAPLGAGCLYVAADRTELLRPLQVSWGWHFDRNRPHVRDEFGSTPWLRSFEFAGSRDVCPWLAAATAVECMEEVGLQAVRRRQLDLGSQVRQHLSASPGFSCVTPVSPELRGGLTAFRLPPHDSPLLRRHLWEKHRIEINLVEHADGILLRVSTHFFNRPEEIEQLALALPAALAHALPN
ncbi:MAG TPA: aminotransferase class V-fold PLP-dependent enzyme [Gemmatales bacterium]|nr:aminotransferase class V-fold PLP-dependent enzyme [Gemmatales bacterium]HMP61060.1 aminotransferase class V-fold PLP-dependent enzyme [Gemmatales bacterium]